MKTVAKGQIKQAQERIDKRQFETLCGMQCTEEEICSVFEVSKDTLLRWCKNTYEMDFADVFKEKRAYGTASLRRTQWRMAEKNVAMAIWLGKQYLGQREAQITDIKMSADDGFIEALGATAKSDWNEEL